MMCFFTLAVSSLQSASFSGRYRWFTNHPKVTAPLIMDLSPVGCFPSRLISHSSFSLAWDFDISVFSPRMMNE